MEIRSKDNNKEAESMLRALNSKNYKLKPKLQLMYNFATARTNAIQ
jgi:hypothetical protein